VLAPELLHWPRGHGPSQVGTTFTPPIVPPVYPALQLEHSELWAGLHCPGRHAAGTPVPTPQ
jgi:hypothetical protein